MPQITLYDTENENTYIIDVSEADAKRANEDLQFATHLLDKYLQATSNVISKPNFDVTKNVTSANASVLQEKDTNTIQETSQNDDDSQEKDSFRWPHEAILLLFKIYTDNEHNLTSGKTTHKKFWELVSSQLIANGYNVTGTQCKSKMAGLKNTYKNVKDHNAKSGNNRRTWRYFDIMNEMFVKKPWVEPVLTLESGSSSITSSDEENKVENKVTECGKRRASSSSCENKLPTKRKKYNTLEKMIEQNAATRQRMHEEAMSRQDKLLDILQKFLQK